MKAPVVNPIIVPLDVPDLDQAESLATRLQGEVGWFKVGLELFSANGPDAVRRIAEFGPVFLDLKLHDIPTTVERAARACGRLGVGMLTVHAAGGATMVAAACEGLADGSRGSAGPTPLVLGVTVLTSMSDNDLASINAPRAAQQVPDLARIAATAGAGGLVCAPPDLAAVRDVVGDTLPLVTPGVRPSWAGADDQHRVATPAEAVRDGATWLVIGRPITRAPDPVEAVRRILAELDAAA